MRWIGIALLMLMMMLAPMPALGWWHYDGAGSHKQTNPVSVGTSILALVGMVIVQAGIVPRLGSSTWSPLTLAVASVGVAFVVGDHIVVSIFGPHGNVGGILRAGLIALVNLLVFAYLFLGALPSLGLLDRSRGVQVGEALALLTVPSILPALILLGLQSLAYGRLVR